MHYRVRTTTAPTQRSRNIHFVSLYLAVFFAVTAVSQLFFFEDFPATITSFGFPIDSAWSPLIAATIVTLEVFAIPFYLRMKISPLLRGASVVAGWIALGSWLFVGLWQSSVPFTISCSGLFGSKLLVPSGWWLVSYMIALLVLNAYVLSGTYFSIHRR